MRSLPVLQAQRPGQPPPGPSRQVSADEARAEPSLLAGGLLRAIDGAFGRLDALVAKALPEELNPLAQTGAIANTTFFVAVASGVALLPFYSSSVHLAYDSVRAMDAMRLGSGLLRSVHRYSSDGCMAFVLLHAAKLFFAGRFAGSRWLAWVTGIALLFLLWFVGWLGYWLVWDERARQVALGTARLLDGLPLFSEPPSRAFLTDAGVSSLSFFVVFFMHMLIPLGMGIALWLHITRLSRSRFLTRTPMTLWVLASLLVVSLALPADTSAPARMAMVPARFTMDWWYLLPMTLTDRLGGGLLWAFLSISGTALFAVPWMATRKRAVTATVEVSRCNGCTLCHADCPYDAIRMVPRTDGREFAVQSQVNPDKCVGCGICAGSCDSAGIDLPWLPALDVRKALDTAVDARVRAEDAPHVAFVCADSAGARVRVDPATGLSSDLPGYLVFPVPCAGWVQARLIERVLRHGARSVLIVACGPGSCTYREGGEWTRARAAGTRPPSPRLPSASGAVRVVELFRHQQAELKRVAEEARAGSPTATKAPSRGIRIAAGLGFAAVATLATWRASSLPYALPGGEASDLVVTFKHPGVVAEHCRKATEAELAKQPIHMRRPEICERRRLPVRLRIDVDGQVALSKEYAPSGLWGDGSSLAMERVHASPGVHRVRVRVGDDADPEAWRADEEREISFGARENRVVIFDRASGLRWF